MTLNKKSVNNKDVTQVGDFESTTPIVNHQAFADMAGLSSCPSNCRKVLPGFRILSSARVILARRPSPFGCPKVDSAIDKHDERPGVQREVEVGRRYRYLGFFW